MRPFEPPSKAVDLSVILSCTSVQAANSRAREGPQCRGQTQLSGCPCSSPEVVEGRSCLFTEIFVTRQVTPHIFYYDLYKKIKMQSWGIWAQSQALHYIKKGGKTEERTLEESQIPSDCFPVSQKCCCCFPALSTTGTRRVPWAASGMLAHSIPLQAGGHYG